jgi:hypothetical protein
MAEIAQDEKVRKKSKRPEIVKWVKRAGRRKKKIDYGVLYKRGVFLTCAFLAATAVSRPLALIGAGTLMMVAAQRRRTVLGSEFLKNVSEKAGVVVLGIGILSMFNLV